MVIDQFLSNQFATKYKEMVIKADNVFNAKSGVIQVKLLNELNNELAAVKEYLAWDSPKISEQAQKLRNDFCNEMIYIIEHILFKSVDQSTVEYVAYDSLVTVTQDLVTPLPHASRMDLKTIATNYKIANVNDYTVGNIPREFEQDLPKEVKENIETITDTTEKSKSGFNWWLVAIAGFVGYKILK